MIHSLQHSCVESVRKGVVIGRRLATRGITTLYTQISHLEFQVEVGCSDRAYLH